MVRKIMSRRFLLSPCWLMGGGADILSAVRRPLVLPLAMMDSIIFVLVFTSIGATACDACKGPAQMVLDPKTSIRPVNGQTSGQVPHGLSQAFFRWSLDSSIEFRQWRKISPSKAFEINDRPHGHIHGVVDEIFISERIGCNITDDFNVGVSQVFRHLRQVNVEDPLTLGQHEFENGFGDLDIDFKYRFKHQHDHGFPVDLTLFGDLKLPTGESHERTPSNELFDAENQPGSGSWDGSLGVSASKRWGTWSAFGAVSGTIKGEGSQDFKAGDLIRVALGASKKLGAEPLGWKLFPSLGTQFFEEFKGKEKGEIDRNHGGQFMFIVPGFAARPLDRLILNATAPIPVYQEHNGTHQKQAYSLQFTVGVQF